MATFLDAATAALRRAYCNGTDRLGVYAELYLGSENPLGSAALQAANFLHNAACDRPPPEATAPPFTGGQCATLYNVNLTMTRASGTVQNPFNLSGGAYGPIRSAFLRDLGGNSTGIFVLGQPFGSNTTGEYGIGSVPTTFGSGTDQPNSVVITSVSRADSAPDTCGNPPDVRPPYTPGDNIVNENVTYVNNEGNTITVPVVIALGYAQVNVNGQLTIPFTLNAPITPTLNVNGTLNLSTGGINFNVGNPALPGSDCSPSSDGLKNDPNVPSSPDPTAPDIPDPDPADDPPQYRRQIRGAWVSTIELPKDVTRIYQDGTPDVFGRDLGLVSFQIAVGGISGWTADIPVKNVRQFIPCPWEGGAVAVRGTPRQGGTFIVSPVYVKVTDQQTFPD